MQNNVLEIAGRKNPGRHLICLEVNPPHGTDLSSVFDRLTGEVGHLDFINVTDSALARMKFAAIPFAALLKQRLGVEPLVNLSCRDRNIIALQGELIAGWVAGVRSIVALTGDAMSVGDCPDLKGVFEINSIGLLNLIEKLNSGLDYAGKELDGLPSYTPGAVVNPNVKNISSELRRLEKKKVAGAKYALSQPVFDIEAARTFLEAAKSIGVPILLGLLPFRNAKSAASVVSQVPGIKLSPLVEEKIKESPENDLTEFFMNHCLELASATKDLVCGFHVVAGITPKLALRLSKRLRDTLGGV